MIDNNKYRKLYRKLGGLLLNIRSISEMLQVKKKSYKYKEIERIKKQLKLSEEDLKRIWFNKKFHIKITDYKEMPQPVHRDNKDTYNTKAKCYRSNRNKVRYPSKKRNKKTWSNFYKLFPSLAVCDNWDGNKSDKYNPKNLK